MKEIADMTPAERAEACDFEVNESFKKYNCFAAVTCTRVSFSNNKPDQTMYLVEVLAHDENPIKK